VLCFGMVLSVSFGAADIRLSVIWEAIFHFNPDVTQHQIIQEVRLPRLLGGAMVGASLAVAGAIMQGMTLNPLADSGLLGLNAGAGFVLALCFAFFPGLPFMYLILFSFLGAGLGAALIFGIGSMARGGLTPVRLVLAGSAVSVVGSVGFVGLIIPHVTRDLVGVDYRWIIPCSAVLGSLLVVFADLAARMVNPPFETPIGALIALIGVPFLIVAGVPCFSMGRIRFRMSFSSIGGTCTASRSAKAPASRKRAGRTGRRFGSV